MAIYVFLGLNGHTVRRPEPEVVSIMTGVASGALSEDDLAEWIESVAEPREGSDEHGPT